MPLSADLQASFSAGGFDLTAAFSGLADVFAGVDLPSLDLDVGISLDIDGIGTDSITDVLAGVTGRLDGVVAGLPDLDALLGPLRLAMRVPELIAGFDLDELTAELTAAIAPTGPGLVPLVQAAGALGSVPLVGSLADLVGALGLDLRAPGAHLGGAVGGMVSLLQLLGALLAVESLSRTIDERAALAADLLAADRLAGLIGRVRATSATHLAGLLAGIDPDDPGIVEIVAEPIDAYLGAVFELTDSLVRGLAFAEATVVDADFGALTLALAAASAALTEAALPPVRALVASAVPLIAPFLTIDVPAGGADVVFGAVAELRTRIEVAIDGFAPSTIAGLIEPAIQPVLAPLRAIRQALDEIAAVVGVVFQPIEQALAAVDLEPVRAALHTVIDPVQDTIDAIAGAVSGAQGAIEDVADGVHSALEPVRTTVTDTAATLTEPFTSVHGVIGALNLAELQATIRATLDSVTAAVSAAPVQPVFDVATGIIGTAADALALVPKALLPDDLRNELEAACAPVESVDLEPARAELHTQLAGMIASLDASALAAVSAGYAAVGEFVASIDPRPHVDALEAAAFAELTDRLDALDPTVLLAPALDALDAAREALNGIDLAEVLAPIDEALEQVKPTIAAIDPTEVLEPVTAALGEATGAVREALHLDDISTKLDEVEAGVEGIAERIPVTATLDAATAAWGDLLAGLRPGATTEAGGGVARALLAGLLPGVPVEGLPEVIAWIRDERDGSAVVRGRLADAEATLSGAAATVGAIDVRALTVELEANHRALSEAVNGHPEGSLVRERLSVAVGSASPAPDLGRVLLNADGVKRAFADAGATVTPATAPDRTEVRLTATGLGATFAPLTAPVAAKLGEVAAFVGVDTVTGPVEPRAALVALAERVGPEPFLGMLRSALTRLLDRLADLVRDGLVAPLRAALGELTGVLDALSIEPVLERFTAVRDRLVALVDGLRSTVLLAEPLAAFDTIKTTLATFDPMGPARAVVDGLRAEIDALATDLAPTTLLAPVLTLYDDLAAAIGAFDVEGLLEPVLAALREIGQIIDRGIDEVIDALGSLKEACESEGGPIPGLDLSVAASVDVGGGFGL